MPATQANRACKVNTALGEDVLLFARMTAQERLSGLFDIELDLVSSESSIDPLTILGTPAGISIDLPQGGQRHLHGFVARFALDGMAGELYRYRARLQPWLWFLTRTADCRIFQNVAVPDIVKTVFRDLGFTDFKDALTRSYQPWEYCVQYRETAFAFVSRLMEHEGIYYYFEHEADKHTLVLADSMSSHATTANYDSVPYYPPEQSGRRKRDHIYDWSMAWEVQSGKYTHTDFDFTKPQQDLKTQADAPRGHGHADGEVFDYPGLYKSTDLGSTLARSRIDERRARYAVGHGRGDARGLAVGALFTLTGFSRADQNKEYLITSATYEAASNEFASGAQAGIGFDYTCTFTTLATSDQFRPPETTPKPVVRGPQTAFVVGPSGQEIYTDEYGRIKVQFHWDRLGKKDENSSCWIRVGQAWAGDKWGVLFIPRINQEVIVDFLEGDPDRPIVTGCVYNGTNKPPYDLPDNATVSTIKSNSSTGGGGSNELKFTDAKGSEEVYFHAQKDFKREVEHDDALTVQNNQTITIKNDRTETVQQGNESVTIAQGNRSVTVSTGNDTLTVRQGNLSIAVSAGAISISAAQSIELKVGGSSLKIDPQGITISGIQVAAQAQGQAQVSGAMVQVSGSGELQLAGGIILIG